MTGMLAEILTIGDELCRGEIIDTNAAWLAGQLWALDVTVAWMTSCRDEIADIQQALNQARTRAELVVVSGGLGPTEDDCTVDAVSDLIGVEAVVDELSERRMLDRLARHGMEPTSNHLRQVRVPGRSRVLGNPVGAAPGFEVTLGDACVICMPGVPHEMKAIFALAADHIIALRESRGERIERIARRTYRTFGAGESQVAKLLEGVMDGVAGGSIHYQVAFPEVLVKVVIRDGDAGRAAARLDELDRAVRSRLGIRIHGLDDDEMPVVLGRALQAAGATLATAESCTGGLVSALVTDAPGSSAYFLGGAITYANQEKIRQLGVSEELLTTHGAVSEECVTEMARGARARFGADYAVAVSGVAGPGGGTEDKPVGTVWLAVAGPRECSTRRILWPGDRAHIRRLSAFWAMAMVLRAVREARHA